MTSPSPRRDVVWATKAEGATLTPPPGRDPELKREEFFFSMPLTKAVGAESKTGDLELTGYASTWQLDRDGEMILPGAYEKSIEAYLDQNPIVLYQHNMDWPLGNVKSAIEDDNGLFVTVVIPQPPDGAADWHKTAFALIKGGVLRTFSVGGYFWREFTDSGMILIREVELLELSVVSIPANAGSIFEAAQKSIKGQTQVTLPEIAVAQMSQVLGATPITDPELLAMDDAGRTDREKYLAGLYRKAGLEAPTRDEFAAIEADSKRIDEAQDPDDDWLLEQVMGLAKSTTIFTQRLQGHADIDLGASAAKAGRVLSKANESKLREAATLINEIVSQVDRDDETEPAAV